MQATNIYCDVSNLFAGNTDHRSFSEESGLDTDAGNDWVSRVEHVLGVDAQFTREDSEMLELFAFLQQPLLTELGEPVEQMVDDVGDEDVDAETIGHLLSLAFNLHVECHYHSVSETNK